MDPLLADGSHPTKGRQSVAGEDQRAARRYSIKLPVQWKLKQGSRVVESGTGTTVNLSSRGILFETNGDLRVGPKIELSISWPFLLLRAVSLQLLVAGEIVRVRGRRVALRMLHHEFRTVRSGSGNSSELQEGSAV